MATGAATELIFTIRPRPWARMTGITALQTVTMPKKFTSNCLFALARSVNSTAPEMPKPALFTTISSRPCSLRICATASVTVSSRVTSAVMWRMPGCGRSRRLISYTIQPFSFKARAVACPMPELPPVTNATCFFSIAFPPVVFSHYSGLPGRVQYRTRHGRHLQFAAGRMNACMECP